MNILKRWSTSTFTIVLAFWLFFPLGFVLVYIRLKEKYGKYYAITKELYWTGIIWGGLGLLYLIFSVNEKDYFIELFLPSVFIFIIPGFLCFYFGNKRNKPMKIYDKYMSYILSRKKVRIDSLCSNLGVSYDTALSTVEDMILKGFINGYIDDDELIITKLAKNSDEFQSVEVKKKETKIIKCKECGAKNTVIVGQTKECEYCGSLLN